MIEYDEIEKKKFLPKDLSGRNRFIPIKLDGKQLTIAMADPSDILKCDNIALRRFASWKIQFFW
jgi:hypothetical protein